MASCIRPMHLQIWCQYRCTELEIVCFGQRRCYSLESKPSTRISVGGERRKTSGQPSRREQFCGNALVARARLVLGQKRKARGFPSVPKRGTSDFTVFRDTYDCRKSKPIYMHLSGCVPVDEKYGAQQAEKEEKRKRNKDKKKKRRRKQRRVMDVLLWEIGREKHNHHVLGPSSERQEFKKVQVHCFWSRGIRTFLA